VYASRWPLERMQYEGSTASMNASVVTLTLLVLTPLFHSLPKAALAAIIMVAVFGLIDVKDVRHLWRVKRSDLGLFVITFAATLGLGMEEGILVGVGASILTFVVRTTHPHTAVLGRVPGTRVYRNIVNYPNALTTPGVITLRMDAQLYFGNVTFLKDALKRLEADLDVPLRAIVIDASSINQVDASADATLLEILERYEERGIGMYFAQCKGPVRQVMERSGLKEQIGEERFFLDLHDAVQAAAVHEPRSSSDERPVTPTSNPINPSPCQAPVNATP